MANPVVLIVLDGWGHREESKDNAIAAAQTPFYDYLIKTYPHSLLSASGESVGLPEGQIGNSEVGHMTIGAGTVIDSDLVRIAKAIRNEEFSTNQAFQKLFSHIKKHDSFLHVLGLVSPGGVHSHEDHLHAFLKAAKQSGISKIVIHAFTDGRDAPPQSGADSLQKLEQIIEDLGVGFIATATGRFYSMDRDQNWDRLAKAEHLLFGDLPEHGIARKIENQKPSYLLRKLYQAKVVDEHLEPIIFLDESGWAYRIQKHDGIFFFNFRADRARQLTAKILERSKKRDLCLVTMTDYDPSFQSLVAFPKKRIETTLAAEIAKKGLAQAHIAETEKYAHATFYLNGGREQPHENEKHVLVESRKDVATHDFAPEMRAEEIADKAIEELSLGADFIFINFANADMVGHTANVSAIIEAIEAVDFQLKRIADKVSEAGGICVITADHGNAEVNVDQATGERHTAHTNNPVPFIVTKNGIELLNGNLADIAPTVLFLLNIGKPQAMTGNNLIY